MTNVNGLTNPFENAVNSLNETQLSKQKRLDDYAEAVGLGYEPPADMIAAIDDILSAGVLDEGALLSLQSLIDQILAETAPEITSDGGLATALVEFAENGTGPVTTVTAIDNYSLNGTDSLTYRLSGGADSALFHMHETSGVLTFLNPPDFEGVVGDLEVIVEVSDGGILIDTQTLTVRVTDLNDTAPVITSAAAVAVEENTTAVMTVTSDDPDTVGAATYSIAGGVDQLLFDIDGSTGDLSFKAAPDFEAPGDVDHDNTYDVVVEVSDGVQSDTQAIAVTVTDVDDTQSAFIFVGGTGQVGDGVSLFSYTDGEGYLSGGKVHSPSGAPDLFFQAGDTPTFPGVLDTFVEWAIVKNLNVSPYEGAQDGTGNWMKVIDDADGAVSWALFEFDLDGGPEPTLAAIPGYVTRTDGADFTLDEAIEQYDILAIA